MAQAYSNPSSSRTSDDIELPRHDGPFEPRALQDEEQIDPWEEGLGTFDVFALIVNKMIGTGIYTAPTTVYLMTGSKSLTLGLFGVGFLYCLMRWVLSPYPPDTLRCHASTESHIYLGSTIG